MRFPNALLICRILVCFFVISQSNFVDARQRDTKTLALENGLEILLINDPEVHRSAAALAVGVGHLYDPEEKMGLAHYLEHMLFLGTKKYPDIGDFKRFLDENSGGSNAYTSSVTTNYFFQVSHVGFEGALDRFSQFFKEPLFDQKYAEREVNAVSSEHDKNILQDGWRSNHVVNLTAELGHPMRKFGTGNKETLAGDNRPALLDFYGKYYAASNMKLVILSSSSLADQENLVRKYFSDIPDHPVKFPDIDANFRKPLHGKYRLLKVKTIKDIRSLTLEFPTIKLHDHLDSKPASIIGSVIGYEGKGSLLSKLKEAGLALGLSAGGGYDHENISSFSISVELTPKGEKEYERILEIIFSYIKMLNEHGIEDYTFFENQAMAQIDFDWKSPDEGMGYVASRAGLMQDFKLDEVETLPYLYEKNDPAAYKDLLATLTPENMLAIIRAQEVETDQTEKFYGTEYSLAEAGGDSFARVANPPEVTGFSYPQKNPFIPEHLDMVAEEPSLVRDDAIAKVYFKFDNRFKQPKVFINLRIETPLIYDSPEDLARSKLYDAAVQEGLNEMVYPIQLAGMSYWLVIQMEGMVLTLGGYSERISDLLKLVAHNLIEIHIDEMKFNDLKEAIIRGIENNKLGQSYSRAAYYSRQLWNVKQYSEEELLGGIEPLTLDDIKAYAKKLYEKIYITAVVHGNWSGRQARESIDLILSELKSKPLPEEDRYVEKIEVLDPEENILFSKQVLDNNNALFYGIQVGEMSKKIASRPPLSLRLSKVIFIRK